MKFTIAAILGLAGASAAQQVQSKPFSLSLKSASSAYDGKSLASCHSGAAIEALCVGHGSSTYYFNTTKGVASSVKGYTASGTLIWNLPISNGPPESEPMLLNYDPSTNVAEALFEAGYDFLPVTFDTKSGQMKVISYYDDTKSPPASGTISLLNNWFVCQTNFAGYEYKTLAWTTGRGSVKPQNSNCVKVDVYRKFK